MGQDLTWASAETSWTINPLLPTGNNLSEETEFLEIFLTNPLSLLSSLPPYAALLSPELFIECAGSHFEDFVNGYSFCQGDTTSLFSRIFLKGDGLWGLTRITRFKIVVLPS